MQWRQPPERVNRLHSEVVEFGRARRRGRGDLYRLDSSGPGVLLLTEAAESAADRAERLAFGGYTVLVPKLERESSDAVVQAAAEYLTENWHPRLGLVAVGAAGAELAAAILDRGPAVEAIALYEGVWSSGHLPRCALIAHFEETADLQRIGTLRDAMASEGLEAELCLYDRDYEVVTADERTLELFDHHLS